MAGTAPPRCGRQRMAPSGRGGSHPRAVRLDPSDAGAHAVLGHMLAKAGDLVRGEVELDEALTLNPGSADILTIYAGWASGLGKPGRGAEAADKAIRLNPSYQPW